jgi:hypothetical protein
MKLIAARRPRSAAPRGTTSRPRRPLWFSSPVAIGAALVVLAAGCQAASPGGPAATSPTVAASPTATPSMTLETASPAVTPTGGPVGSPSQAPLEACNANNVQEPQLIVAVGNRGPASYFLEIVGRDGACNWRIAPTGQDGSVGAVTVAAGPSNSVRVLAASDCAALAEETAEAGTYTLEIRGSTVEFRPVQNVDALALGTPPGPPCTPGA